MADRLAPVASPEEAQDLLRQIVDEFSKRGFFSPARTPVPVDECADFIDESGPEKFTLAMIEVLRVDETSGLAARRLKAGPPEYLIPAFSDEEIEAAIDEALENPQPVGDDPPDESEDFKLVLVQEFLRHVDLEASLAPTRGKRRRPRRRRH